MNKDNERKMWILVSYGFVFASYAFYWVSSNGISFYSGQALGFITMFSVLAAVIATIATIRTRKFAIFIPALILAIIVTFLNDFSRWFSGYIF